MVIFSSYLFFFCSEEISPLLACHYKSYEVISTADSETQFAIEILWSELAGDDSVVERSPFFSVFPVLVVLCCILLICSTSFYQTKRKVSF